MFVNHNHLRTNIEAFIEHTIIAAACTRRLATNRPRSSSSNSSALQLSPARP
jgi:hypothetical protein